MASNRVINFQLTDENGRHIMASGGMVMVCAEGSPDKVSIFDDQQVAASNPKAMNRGSFYCQVAKAVRKVDVFIYSPTGHCIPIKSLTPGDRQHVRVDTKELSGDWIIPFSHADSTDAVEKDSGVDLPTGALVDPMGLAIDVVDADATETISVGILSTEPSGDADGFVVTASIATAGVVRVAPTAAGPDALGVLLKTLDSANAGDDFPADHVVLSTSRSLSYTTSAGTDSGAGYIRLPVKLARVADLTLQ